MATILLRNARLIGTQTLSDLLIDRGRISALTPAGFAPKATAKAIDLEGRVVMPGLWDEHVHFTQWVTMRARFDIAGAGSAAEVLVRVREEVAANRGDGQLTGYGFRDATWPDAPSLAGLDAVTGERPVVVISGDLHCAWVNSAAARLMRVSVDATGLLREGDWFNIPAELRDGGTPPPASFAAAAEAAAQRGVVGIVDFENTDNLAEWPERVAAGVDRLRVEASVWPDRLEGAIQAGLRTGDPLESRGLVTMGHLKVVVDGSLNTRTAWCWDPYPGLDPHHAHACGVVTVAPSELRRLIVRACAAGIAPAVHAIGDRANFEVIELFAQLGITGRIEHAQFVRAGDFARFGELGLVASVQPEHAMDDRDVADRYWAGRTDRAFAFGSLYQGGATLRLGSDAPVAPLDPWLGIAAATSRSRAGREAWHPQQRLPLPVVLAASARGRSDVAVGDVADLVVLDADPYLAEPELLRRLPVAATLLAGRFTWRGF